MEFAAGRGGFSGEAGAARVHVRRLFVGPDTAGGFVRDSVLRVARRLDIPVDTLVRGDVFSGVGEGALGCVADVAHSLGVGNAPRVEVLWPPDYVREGGNPASVVLRVEYGASTALLTGDLDSAGERRLLELSPSLSAGLLQVGHHGSAGSSSLRFVAQVAPEYAVVSVGADNRYGHPAPSVVNKFGFVLGDTARFFRTDRDGSVTFELWPDLGVVVNTN
jgi:competence protein ComEC